MGRSYYTDGTAALDAASSSNVISFDRHVRNSCHETICQHAFNDEPNFHGTYSFEMNCTSRSERVKSILVVVIPVLVMFAAIIGPAFA